MKFTRTQINFLIHTLLGDIYAKEIKGIGDCIGVMLSSMHEGAYPPLHRIRFPQESIIEDFNHLIMVQDGH
jgi:hypothetical protein